MERVDVAIVGGGPAGASAARTAAEGGAEAVLVEQGVPRADREGPGPDSTDAAGFLDYWVDVAGLDYEAVPDDVILQDLDRAVFVGPTERVELPGTGMNGSYPHFGFTFHRARMDDWLRERAEDAGADYRVGTGVASLDSEREAGGDYTHVLTLQDDSQIAADRVVLADGPQRRITLGVLDRFLPDDGPGAGDVLGPDRANHIAYQEYREFPEEAFDPSSIVFWWGVMPGETAYPWVFPNDGTVARVGLTMPIDLDLSSVANREAYALLRPDDERVPRGGEYIRRLLEREYGDEYDVESDFPLVEDRGKNGGTETYPISSTRPVDSPVGAGIAVAGGAMGTTSAFHEGGYHVAMRTGAIAGELAAEDSLERYNSAWKAAVGEEIVRNVAMADVVREYGPSDWDRAFKIAQRFVKDDGENGRLTRNPMRGGWGALKLFAEYKWTKFGYRGGRYVQISEGEYVV